MRKIIKIISALGLGLGIYGCVSNAPIDYSGPIDDWPQAGGARGGGHYSDVTQITKDNVADLEIAWTHRSGDYRTGGNTIDGVVEGEPFQTSFQVTPVLFEGTLYYCTPYNRVFALDPNTGVEQWSYDPEVAEENRSGPCRGVATWTSSQVSAGAACHRRILTGTVDGRLIALDADSGRPCDDFGDGGTVNALEGLGEHPLGEYKLTTPGGIIGDLIVIGGAISDNLKTTVPGGVVRAYDLNTGTLVWYWDPIPPGKDPVLEGDKQKYQRGTSNVWSYISTDEELGLVYAPTGNSSPDYYGGHRDGLDYYSSSIVALDAQTGEVRWHFQTVHHDIWDYDLPAQPTLFDLRIDGKVVKALAQTTKMGHVFVLDRTNGEPIYGVEERPVPQGAVEGDFTVPTQPFPIRPRNLVNTDFTADDVWGFTPWDRGACRDMMESIRSEGLFTPPTLQGSIHYPSAVGGQNWGGPAVDSERGLLIVNSLHMASIIQLVPRAECDAAEAKRLADPLGSKYAMVEDSAGTPYCDVRWMGFFSPLEVPCTPPPWGTIAGIDLQKGEVAWQVPLGTTRDLAPFPFWFIDGVPNMGGPITTASGLTFIAATSDYFLRAFDSETGVELWKGRLPTGGQATPMTYRAGPADRQYVVIAAGGHWALGTPASDHVIAFALPE
ncbi:MAG: pyrroloquinoline quinone-dependent dehydrogenase [Pseudomonadota bacterium]|nr:pyrroloquinoline quinone-dependent dehydrogenase [Pseudomonadota bacterium]